MFCGVDEAGRGPVIGPLIVAAVMVEDDSPLIEMKVKDSKKLSAKERQRLSDIITTNFRHEIVQISAESIDERKGTVSLNTLEIRAFATAIDRLGANVAYVDACDVNERHFATLISRELSRPVRLICEHKADERYPVVSAASIVAKHHRDEAMRSIAEELGEVGSGYCSDPKTKAFLEKWINEKGDLPPYTRRSWATAKVMLGASKISKLTDWE